MAEEFIKKIYKKNYLKIKESNSSSLKAIKKVYYLRNLKNRETNYKKIIQIIKKK